MPYVGVISALTPRVDTSDLWQIVLKMWQLQRQRGSQISRKYKFATRLAFLRKPNPFCYIKSSIPKLASQKNHMICSDRPLSSDSHIVSPENEEVCFCTSKLILKFFTARLHIDMQNVLFLICKIATAW